MNNQKSEKGRIKVCSMSFLKALKPKINQSSKQKPRRGNIVDARGLFRNFEGRLTPIPGSI